MAASMSVAELAGSAPLDPPPAPSFQDLLKQLEDSHARELHLLEADFDSRLACLRAENESLRCRLSGDGIGLQDVLVEPCAAAAASAEWPPKAAAEAPGPEAEAEGDAGAVRRLSSSDPQWTPLPVGQFKMKPGWNRSIEHGRQWGSKCEMFLGEYGKQGHLARLASSEDDSEQDAQPHTDCVIFPNSTFRLSWDLSGLVLIGYDLITIPFNQAFNPTPTWFSIGMDWITLLFWTGDMLQGFFLGYFEKGQYISSHKKILKHYMLTWFIPDVIVIGPEWLMNIASSTMGGEGNSVGEVGKILKGARAVRVLRLVRLLKLQRIINLLYDMIESEHTFICVNLAKLLLSVLVLNHVIACMWYFIGRVSMESDLRNWIEVGNVEDSAMPYKYTTSLHWSLTQFTPASMDVSARNTFERIFSIIVLFFAMVAFSSIVGSITGSMTSLRNMKAEEMKQFWLLRRYLRQRHVSPDLSNRIFKYLDYQCQKQGKLVQEKSIRVLGGLSEALYNELAHQMHSPYLRDHPFFSHLDADMNVVMHRLCFQCLKPHAHAEREVIFSAGEEARKMLFIKGGDLEYTMMDESKLSPPPKEKEWISEATLWTSWRHQGELLSVSTSEFIALDPVQFTEVMSVHPRPWLFAKSYARKFLDFLNGIHRYELIDIIRAPEFYLNSVTSSDCGNVAARPSSAEALSRSWTSAEQEPAREAGTKDAAGCGEAGLSSGVTGPAKATPLSLARRRALSFCPCVTVISCDPWCSISVDPSR